MGENTKNTKRSVNPQAHKHTIVPVCCQNCGFNDHVSYNVYTRGMTDMDKPKAVGAGK